MLGGVFAIVIVKQIYGGLGQNFMNPALAARCFLLISFAGKMSSFSSGWRNHRYSSERDEDCMEGWRVQPGRRSYGYVHR